MNCVWYAPIVADEASFAAIAVKRLTSEIAVYLISRTNETTATYTNDCTHYTF